MPQATDIVRNTIKRDGVSQQQRKVPALDPSSVKIDDRTLEDFLVFTLEFSKQVHYYNLAGQQEGDWQNFWNCDPTLVIAAIEKTNPLPGKQSYEQILQNTPGVVGLHGLFESLTGIARQIDFWYTNLQERSDFKSEIKRLIEANFTTLLPRLAAYEKGAGTLFATYPDQLAAGYEGFSGIWNLSVSDWNDIEPDISLFQPIVEIGSDEPVTCMQDFSQAERLKAAYKRLSDLLTSTYNVYFHIIQISPAYFQSSLTRKDHPPHIALFITFLLLYRQVQDDLNGLTAKHLDFFYKDVLGLKTKPAVPDKVHLFFELAKNVPEYELLARIRFKAGKDDTGKNLFYTLDKNTVLNTAKVESLRTLFLDLKISEITKERIVNGIHAAPVANSVDGLGEAIKDKEDPSWAAVGSTKMPKASLGFAVASNELLLGEGTRTVTLRIYANEDIPALPANAAPFDVFLSGKKAWIPVADPKVDVVIPPQVSLDTKHLKIEFTLTPDIPAVLPFDAKALKEDLGTTLPVLKVVLNEKSLDYSYELLRRLTLEKVKLTVDVKGIQQVVAFNDDGPVDTKKPFMPFGASPKVESGFYVGNVEAFQKNLQHVTLNLHWQQVVKKFGDHYLGYNTGSLDYDSFQVKIASIGAGQENLSTTPVEIFNPLEPGFTEADGDLSDRKVDMSVTNAVVRIARLLSPDEAGGYGQDNKNGFLRLDLQRDFEHDQFQHALARQMLAAAKFPTRIVGAFYLDSNGDVIEANADTTGISSMAVIIPKAPYTPVLKSVTLDYVSTTGDGEFTLLQIHPYPNAYRRLATASGQFLLPQFTTSQTDPETDREETAAPSTTILKKAVKTKSSLVKAGRPKLKALPALPLQPASLEQGALLIGLSQLQPLQNLMLLFQVVENSADAEIPKAQLRWHYLADNQWRHFEEFQVVSDTTDQLTTSGIVELSIPEGINKNNTILPSQWHWLKVSVTRDAGAVSRLINVHTQAVRATFQDNDNDPAHLAKPLAAQVIGKLENDDSALKSINQPYESFGGLPAEAPLDFYTRVSERLRHKGRAITQFDYERLILDAFPSIYKVKCINHTDDQYQLHPGHVLISVVPDFTKLAAGDRLQPKVTLAKLEEIKRYLEARNSAFVCAADTSLHVLNPKYQIIEVDFEVKFKPEITAIDYHRRKLQDGIIRFLAPWAYEDGAQINFGGKLYRSSILNFVEEQPYVDYVTRFKMMREGSKEDLSEIEADTPRSILVPAAAEKLVVRPILTDDYCPAENLIFGKTLGYITLEETKIGS